jgi:glucose-1-phosphate thymidylyltransferase
LNSLTDPENIELINIVGFLGDQIEAHIREHYPEMKAHYVIQEDPRGQSHAIYLAKDYLVGPLLIVFADTVIKTDLSCLRDATVDSIAWVKPVSDPRRFGVAEVNGNGWVNRLIEKPTDMSNNLAVVGFYYFKDSRDLIAAIEEQMMRKIEINGEYFLADAINIMLERGTKMRTCSVDVWLDAGTPESLLETNRYLLENGMDNSAEASKREGIVVIPPVFIHPSAVVEHSVIGPHTSLGVGCQVRSSIVRGSILADAAQVTDAILEDSLVGQKAQIKRRAGVINAGDQTIVSF